MKGIFFSILFIFITAAQAQNQELAQNFFQKGAFEKALIEYDKLLQRQPSRSDYIIKKVKCLQGLSKFKKAHQTLKRALNSHYRQPQYLIEIGYNYALQKDSVNAHKNYQNAINVLDHSPQYAYTLGRSFEEYNLLQEAKATYLKVSTLDENSNFHFQLARVYGQLNETQNMFDSYLSVMRKNDQLISTVQRIIGQHISENAQDKNNLLFKRALLKKLQSDPSPFWNEQLSWFYIQQQEYQKAFIQEKAIYKRQGSTLDRMYDLALITRDNEKYEEATVVLNFIKSQIRDDISMIRIQQYLMEIAVETTPVSKYPELKTTFESLFETYGYSPNTIELQLLYADFLGFKMQRLEPAIELLKTHQNQGLSRFFKARFQMKLADLMVASGQFNQALINYSKIQKKLKNNVLSQEARFKVAKTSYYKGDFDWALQQLSVLKSSTSQLIANDALDLHLLINDHIKNDSLHIALKKYAKADLYAFQNNNKQAITVLNELLKNHKGDPIEDDALYLQARLFQQTNQFNKAIKNYEVILNSLKESIFTDNTLFNLSNLYINQLLDKEKAKEYLEAIIFNHADSIHFVEAQKKYRKLRGDPVN